MPIQIEGRHIKVTQALQDHVHKKTDHLDKYFDGISNLRIVLSLEPPKQKTAEVVCSVVRGKKLVASATNDDMYLAIDDAVHKIKELLKKHKARLRGRKRDSTRTRAESPPSSTGDEDDEE